jgi:hypothetical protein
MQSTNGRGGAYGRNAWERRDPDLRHTTSSREARVAERWRDTGATGGVTWGREGDGRAGRMRHSWRGR